MHDDAPTSDADLSVLAALDVRHTRRHMPTRRIALGDAYLPASGTVSGAVLLSAVVGEFVAVVDEEELDALRRLVREAHHGLAVPRIALRHRLQTDTHGLDRSRHRILRETGALGGDRLVFEVDAHGAGIPQVLGAVMAAAALGASAREQALRAIAAAIRHPGELPEGVAVRRLHEGIRGPIPLVSRTGRRLDARAGVDGWAGVPAERRWAMEVLGIRSDIDLDRRDVLARFRRLVRTAHPDHGAGAAGAAERIAELTEAREHLLAAATTPGARR